MKEYRKELTHCFKCKNWFFGMMFLIKGHYYCPHCKQDEN